MRIKYFLILLLYGCSTNDSYSGDFGEVLIERDRLVEQKVIEVADFSGGNRDSTEFDQGFKYVMVEAHTQKYLSYYEVIKSEFEVQYRDIATFCFLGKKTTPEQIKIILYIDGEGRVRNVFLPPGVKNNSDCLGFAFINLLEFSGHTFDMFKFPSEVKID